MRRLSVLLRGLPEDALSNTNQNDSPPWGVTEELLAQLLEEVSLLATYPELRRPEPVAVPRPWRDGSTPAPRVESTTPVSGPDGSMTATGALAVASMMGAAVVVTGGDSA